MKINVEFSTLGDMVNFADFVMNQSSASINKKKVEEYERMLQTAQSQLERAYERLRDKEGTPHPILEKPIDDIVWTNRTFNCFKADRIETFGQLVKLTANDLLRMPNFGRKSLKEVRDELATLNLKLSGD